MGAVCSLRTPDAVPRGGSFLPALPHPEGVRRGLRTVPEHPPALQPGASHVAPRGLLIWEGRSGLWHLWFMSGAGWKVCSLLSLRSAARSPKQVASLRLSVKHLWAPGTECASLGGRHPVSAAQRTLPHM